jgi:hypothetical protein
MRWSKRLSALAPFLHENHPPIRRDARHRPPAPLREALRAGQPSLILFSLDDANRCGVHWGSCESARLGQCIPRGFCRHFSWYLAPICQFPPTCRLGGGMRRSRVGLLYDCRDCGDTGRVDPKAERAARLCRAAISSLGASRSIDFFRPRNLCQPIEPRIERLDSVTFLRTRYVRSGIARRCNRLDFRAALRRLGKSDSRRMRTATVLLAPLLVLTSCESVKLGLGRTLTNKHQATRAQEHTNGAIVVMDTIPKGWTKPFKLAMNNIWKDLNLQGVSYFAFGGPQGLASYSSRADFRSPRYQAWVGVYAVDARRNVFGHDNALINRDPGSFIPELSRLAEHDQKAWLRSAGDPSPKAQLIQFRRAGTVRIAGADRPVYEATMKSHSDLASNDKGVAALLGRPKPSYWTPHLSSYHDVTLKGWYAPWYESETQALFVAYGNGASFRTNSGESIDYTSAVRAELENMFAGVRIQQTRR